MRKKGFMGIEMIQWFIRIVFLALIVFTAVFFTKTFIKRSVDINQQEMDLFIKRVVYSPSGISYVDHQIDRVYPGIIDYNKFKRGNEWIDNTQTS
jgi:hypothetical protein